MPESAAKQCNKYNMVDKKPNKSTQIQTSQQKSTAKVNTNHIPHNQGDPQ